MISWKLPLLCWYEKIKGRVFAPVHVLRLCRRRSEFLSIVNEATTSAPPWPTDLVDRVVQYVLEEGSGEVSVYATKTVDPLDFCHALGVIAEGIIQKDFQPSTARRAKECTRGTFLIPASTLPSTARLQFTPKHNTNFFPADVLHYDLWTRDFRQLAECILDGIHTRAIHWTWLGKDGSYQVQAAIAYAYCLSRFGELNEQTPPAQWRNGRDLTGGAQIEILRHLAKAALMDNRLEADGSGRAI